MINQINNINEQEKPLRICMVSEEEIVGQSAIIPGGIGQYILRYSRMLAELGHEVTILCQSNQNFEIISERIKLVGLPRRGKIPWDITVYFWLLRQHFNIVEFPEWGGHGALPSMFLPKKAGRIVTRGHGHKLLVQRVHGLREKKGKQHIKEWLQVHFSRGVLANSEFLKDQYIKDFSLKSSRINVCHIGIDPRAIGSFQSVQKTYQGPTLIYVGGMDHRKGPELLLRILNEMNKLHSEFKAKLIMIGQDTPTGPNRSSYLQHCIDTAHKLGVYNQIEFIPATPRSNLYDYYSRASVFVSASRAESLGIPFLEAMSVGIPVVTWNTGAAPELINHGKDGLLYDLNNIEGFATGLLSLLKDKELWGKFSVNALDNVKHRFMEKDVLKHQVSWYQQISSVMKNTKSG